MNLRNKKELAARTMKIGKNRIKFVESRLEDIKEAITKQDIRDLVNDKAIIIKDRKGRKKTKKSSSRKSTGNIRKKVNTRKQRYVKLTRKLRKYVKELKEQGKITSEEVKKIRRDIRNKKFKNKASLKNFIGGRK